MKKLPIDQKIHKSKDVIEMKQAGHLRIASTFKFHFYWQKLVNFYNQPRRKSQLSEGDLDQFQVAGVDRAEKEPTLAPLLRRTGWTCERSHFWKALIVWILLIS